jgi:hypothetical protein
METKLKGQLKPVLRIEFDKDQFIEMNMDVAKELFELLNDIFGKKTTELPVYPYPEPYIYPENPYRPVITFTDDNTSAKKPNNLCPTTTTTRDI